MIHLLIVILDDLKRMPPLLEAWQAAGVPGATILQSAGAYRVNSWLSQMGLGALDRLFESREVRRRTLLTAIEGEELLERAVCEAERVVGGFDRPESGLLLVLPVAQIRGLHKARPKVEEFLPPAIRPGWIVQRDTPVEVAAAMLNVEPAIVRADTTLDQVAQAFLAQPNVHVMSVVAEDGRLVGVIPLRLLADDLFFRILPEEFLGEVTDLEDVVAFAEKSRLRTAADAMQAPVWVKHGEPVKAAFIRMHEHGLSGLPVVDDRYHVVGYINVLQLVALFAAEEAAPAGGEGAGR